MKSWITEAPERNIIFLNEEEYPEHVDYLLEQGYVDDDLDLSESEDEESDEGEWLYNKVIEGIKNHDLIRVNVVPRTYFQNNTGKQELLIQGNSTSITPTIIEKLLKEYKLPNDTLITIEDTDGTTLYQDVTLSEYLLQSDKKKKRQSELAKLTASLGEYQ